MAGSSFSRALSGLAGALFGGRLPSEVRTALALEPGERLLSHARTAGEGAGGAGGAGGGAGEGGGYAVATTLALHLPGGHRLPWHLMDKATWDETGVTVAMTDGETHRVPLPEPGLLPETIRERVTSSIVASRHVPLDARGGVRLVARRVPGTDEPRWEFVFDPGLDPGDPGLRALAEQALEEVRRSLGV
ncbi:hypothetical protein [Microtetraspora sp. NBRC 16547]|uniref:hypothetical protein n=1 Tax=Microtetraspora sp. NBRC 16547 TaxID=3030993 RepID=UPI0024A52CA3|nr:hypothetical protein [Microtetraspora sp. NBRC 16547]GLW97831.1 hypothetical protein Misp02_19180 [Microtetraspora sp. NBRC 16547]